jgi:hypothetical protein
LSGTYAAPGLGPALVGWYGGWGSVSVNVGGPVYGWVPLGWGDPYVPWWGRGGCGQRCWTHYNRPYAVPYVANRAERPHAPPTVYANSRVPGAITAVAGSTMAGRRPVAPNVIALSAGAAHAPVMGSAPALKPLRIPEAGPIAKVPAPASTFYPSAKPRLAITHRRALLPGRRSAARPAFDRAPVSVRPAPLGGDARRRDASDLGRWPRPGRARRQRWHRWTQRTSSLLTAVPPARVEAPAAPARAPTAAAPAGRSGSWPPATAVPPARVEAPAAPARAPQSGAVPRTSGASSIALPPTPMRVAPTPGASAPPAPVAAPVAPAPGPAPRAAPQRESRGPAPAHAAPGGAAGENPRGGPRSAVEGPGQGSAPGR